MPWFIAVEASVSCVRCLSFQVSFDGGCPVVSHQCGHCGIRHMCHCRTSKRFPLVSIFFLFVPWKDPRRFLLCLDLLCRRFWLLLSFPSVSLLYSRFWLSLGRTRVGSSSASTFFVVGSSYCRFPLRVDFLCRRTWLSLGLTFFYHFLLYPDF